MAPPPAALRFWALFKISAFEKDSKQWQQPVYRACTLARLQPPNSDAVMLICDQGEA